MRVKAWAVAKGFHHLKHHGIIGFAVLECQATRFGAGQGDVIGKTAIRLGFSDASYFSRWFRRQTGITPSVWQFRSLGNR